MGDLTSAVDRLEHANGHVHDVADGTDTKSGGGGGEGILSKEMDEMEVELQQA